MLGVAARVCDLVTERSAGGPLFITIVVVDGAFSLSARITGTAIVVLEFKREIGVIRIVGLELCEDEAESIVAGVRKERAC